MTTIKTLLAAMAVLTGSVQAEACNYATCGVVSNAVAFSSYSLAVPFVQTVAVPTYVQAVVATPVAIQSTAVVQQAVAVPTVQTYASYATPVFASTAVVAAYPAFSSFVTGYGVNSFNSLGYGGVGVSSVRVRGFNTFNSFNSFGFNRLNVNSFGVRNNFGIRGGFAATSVVGGGSSITNVNVRNGGILGGLFGGRNNVSVQSINNGFGASATSVRVRGR